MNQVVRNSIAFVGQFIPLEFLQRGTKLPPFLPFYHVVSDVELNYINSYVVRTQIAFEKELDFLLKNFNPVSLTDILNAPAKNKMHLSFDDGLKACYSIIAPVLKRKGIPATFFVSPNFIDNKSLFHRFKRSILESKGILTKGGKNYFIQETDELDKLAKQNNIDFSSFQPYLSFDELKSLYDDGFTIGGHSLNHPEMWTMDEDEQFRQVIDSMQWIVDHFNPEIKAFSFPFTDNGIRQSVFNRIEESSLVDITFGTAGLKFDQCKTHLQRIPVELKQNWSIKKVVHFEYFYYFVRSLIGKNTVIR